MWFTFNTLDSHHATLEVGNLKRFPVELCVTLWYFTRQKFCFAEDYLAHQSRHNYHEPKAGNLNRQLLVIELLDRFEWMSRILENWGRCLLLESNASGHRYHQLQADVAIFNFLLHSQSVKFKHAWNDFRLNPILMGFFRKSLKATGKRLHFSKVQLPLLFRLGDNVIKFCYHHNRTARMAYKLLLKDEICFLLLDTWNEQKSIRMKSIMRDYQNDDHY